MNLRCLLNYSDVILRLCRKKIEARTDYASSICDNPIKLREPIKEHSLSFEETYYEIATIAGALRNFISCEQKDGEPLLDYTRRFKVT